MQILIVEDEKRLANALREIVSNEKYKVDVVYDGQDGYDYAVSGIYDCIILDVMLPKMDGFTVLKKLRENNIKTPILLLTAKDSIADKVNGLDIGADDYMTKPFNPEELLARIRVITRRKGEVVLDKLDYKELSFYLSSKDLVNNQNGKKVHLNFKEAEIINLFMRSPGVIISKDDLITKVWGYDSDASDNNVEAYVSFIRKKLQFLDSSVEINSLKKIGYILGEKK